MSQFDTAPAPGDCTERELTAPVNLCTDDGRLNRDSIGWSRSPVHDCRLPGSWGRRKRWDYWCVTTPKCVLMLTYANVDYLGLADVWFLDLESERSVNRSAATPLAVGFKQPDKVDAESIAIDLQGLEMAITEADDGTRLTATFAARGHDFECDVFVERPAGHETLSVVIPWGSRQFQCTTKENTRPATGAATVNGITYDFDPATAWGCLDFGRGKWPYSTNWNWGSASGRQGDHIVGLQLGGKWTDGTGMTENALCIDGRLSKLSEELIWEYFTDDWMRPWTIRTPVSDRADLTFTPRYLKRSRFEALVTSASTHQCFGTYSGMVTPDDGQAIEIDDLFGWVEEARWRW